MEPSLLTPLLGQTRSSLSGIVSELGLPSYASGQISDWLYRKRVATIAEMTNLSLQSRSKLSASYEVGLSLPSGCVESSDGVKKYEFAVRGGVIQTAYIPMPDRHTLCLSTQVGCRMGCTFCATGRSGFTSNLSAAEILNQLHSISESSLITNVVFMGMGEPFDNADVLFSVLEIMTSSYGYGWSPKRITVSTVGHVNILERFLKESECHLAISLHSPYSSERVQLVPSERIHPVSELLRLIRGYDFFHQRRVSFEYIMFSGINDDTSHAESLLRLLRGIPCRVNLLRYHAIPGVDLRGSELESMFRFRDYLNDHGLLCTIRTSRGEEIGAACGMLSSSNKVRRR